MVLSTLLRYQVSLLLVLVACTVTLASSLVLSILFRYHSLYGGLLIDVIQQRDFMGACTRY
jgi:hypothetical protein